MSSAMSVVSSSGSVNSADQSGGSSELPLAVAKACRSCGGSNLMLVLTLGQMPLANALLTEQQLSQGEETFPLDLAICSDCSLVQITETVPPEKLFGEYFYMSSFSETMLRHAESLTDQVVSERNLDASSLVIEIASNDGYLLQFYQHAGIPVLGIEPARNIARVAEDRGVPTLCDFFSADLAEILAGEGRSADVIHANNVLAHVADLNGTVEGISRLLKPDGVAIIEVPYVKEMIDRCEFDTIYHEHLCYFSLTALDRLFTRHNLTITDIQLLAIHGGTLRFFANRADGSDSTVGQSEAVKQLIAQEKSWGVDQAGFYLGFSKRVNLLKHELLSLLHQIKSKGNRIAAYGASAKGSTLLNYFGLGKETLEFVVDRSTVKQGFYTPGTQLKIYPPEHLLETMPDYVLLLTWNFADEILAQQSEYRRRGGRFVIPIPELRVV